MNEAGVAPRPAAGGRGRGWAIAMIVLTAACLALPILVVRGALWSIKDAADQTASAAGDALRSLAQAFREGTVETSLRSYASELKGVSRLQVAELTVDESFERRDSATVAWGALPLPDVVVEARGRVTYLYAVDLQKPWRLEIDETARRVRVLAPQIEAGTPALDPSSLNFRVREGSVLRDEEAVRDNLQRTLGALLVERGQDHRSLVTETARRKVSEFVRAWILSRYDDAETYLVETTFVDESAPQETGPRG